jgi:hypothetical protein
MKGMKQPTIRFKSLNAGLKELQPFVINGQHLYDGRPFKNMGGLRSREVLGNWLICATVNAVLGEGTITFTSMPSGLEGDGVLCESSTAIGTPTEHVFVRRAAEDETRSIEQQIVDAVTHKSKKGEQYAKGTTLVVFLEAGGGGPWHPNKAAKMLPINHFNEVWVVGLHLYDAGRYIYGVSLLNVERGAAPTFTVNIAPDFESWVVTQIQ